MTLVKVLERAIWLHQHGDAMVAQDNELSQLLFGNMEKLQRADLELFCRLDDSDVISAIKKWRNHPDRVLSILCNALLDRKLFKLRMQNDPITVEELHEKRAAIAHSSSLSQEDASFLVFTGEAENSLYNPNNERINILFKDGKVRDISQVDSPLIHQNLSRPVKKFYICYYQS
jgi:hypothetical protein